MRTRHSLISEAIARVADWVSNSRELLCAKAFRCSIAALCVACFVFILTGPQQAFGQQCAADPTLHHYKLRRVDLHSQVAWPAHWLEWLDYNAEAVIAYNAMYIGAPTGPRFRFNITYAGDRDEFERLFKAAADRDIGGGTVGVTLSRMGTDVHRIFVYNEDLVKNQEGGWDLKREGNSFCTILHEMCHAVHKTGAHERSFGELPLPFQEGLSDYIAEQLAYVSIPKKKDRIQKLKELLELTDQRSFPTLEDFFSAKGYEDWDVLFKGKRYLGYNYGMFLVEYFLTDPIRANLFYELMSPMCTTNPQQTEQIKGLTFLGNVTIKYRTGVAGLRADFIQFLRDKLKRIENAPQEIVQYDRLYKVNQQHLNKLLTENRPKNAEWKLNEQRAVINQWLTTWRYEAEAQRIRGLFSLDGNEVALVTQRCDEMRQIALSISKQYKKNDR